ncbi:MAG: hypothetical protein ABSB83_02280 [Methanomassiliicoccales archaeon]
MGLVPPTEKVKSGKFYDNMGMCVSPEAAAKTISVRPFLYHKEASMPRS